MNLWFKKQLKIWFNPTAAILFGIILLGLGLRLINLGSEPYWSDEALSIDIVEHYQDNTKGMVEYLQLVEVHPPLYYIILDAWTEIFGFGEAGVRLLSVLFGLGVIILTYILASKLFSNNKVSLLAAFFVAILPIQIEFSQEARPYIIYTFFFLLAALMYWLYRTEGRKHYIFWYIVATLLGSYLHYSYAFFAASLAGAWLIDLLVYQRGKKLSQGVITWLIAHGLIFIIYFIQFQFLLFKLLLTKFNLHNLSSEVTRTRYLVSFESILNQLVWTSKNEPIFRIELVSILLFKLSLMLSVFWLLVSNARQTAAKFLASQAQLIYIFVLAILPVVLFLLSPQGTDYAPVFERHIIPVSVLMAILFAYLVAQLKFKQSLLLATLFIVSLVNFIFLIVSNDEVWDSYHRMKIIAQHINQAYQPGDLVIIAQSNTRSDFNHYFDDQVTSVGMYPLNLIDYEQDVFSSRKTLGLIEAYSSLKYDQAEGFDNQKLDLKMRFIMRHYQPRRVWTIAGEASSFKDWLEDHNWSVAMDSLGPLFPVKLYVQR